VRKLLYIFAVLLLIAAAALTFWWSRSRNSVNVSINNESGRPLDNITVISQGRSLEINHFVDGDAMCLDEARFTFNVQLSFDVDGKHYEFPIHTHMLPFGDSAVVISFDSQKKLSVQSFPILNP
jgi:hypothetical protein